MSASASTIPGGTGAAAPRAHPRDACQRHRQQHLFQAAITVSSDRARGGEELFRDGVVEDEADDDASTARTGRRQTASPEAASAAARLRARRPPRRLGYTCCGCGLVARVRPLDQDAAQLMSEATVTARIRRRSVLTGAHRARSLDATGAGATASCAPSSATCRCSRRSGATERSSCAGRRGGLDHLRSMLAVDDDHAEFLRRFSTSSCSGTDRTPPGQRVCAWRRSRTPCCARSADTIDSRTAARSSGIVPSFSSVGDLHASPDRATLARASPASCARSACTRGAAHARAGLPLGRARAPQAAPSPVVAERLERERGLGPWSVGVVGLEGLGRRELGLVGDLGLVKLGSRSRAAGSRATRPCAPRAVRRVGRPRERLPDGRVRARPDPAARGRGSASRRIAFPPRAA